jgi:PPOX class probable F420-dependent enzyme
MKTMSQAEIEQFLQEPRHAIAGTNPVNGPPQLSPVWYLYEAGRLYISLLTRTAKYHNLQRDPRISLCIDGGHPDARAVMIYGQVELVAWGEPLEREMWWRIIRHYHDSEAAAHQYADSVREMPSALAVVTPEKIISQDFN